MFRLWLRQLARRLFRTPNRRRFGPRLPRRPRMEPLEDRTMPATITWNNAAGGAWETAANWTDQNNNHRVPTTGDDVVIPDLGTTGPSLTITYNSSSTISSLTSSENVSMTGGSLTVTGNTSLLAGTFSQGTPSPASASVTLQGNLELDGTLIIQGRSVMTEWH